MNRLCHAALLLALLGTTPLVAQKRPDYLDASQILKLITDSETHYSVRPETAGTGELANPLATMYADGLKALQMVMIVKDDNGKPGFTVYRIPDRAMAEFDRATPLVREGRFDEARAIYREVITALPDCYVAHTYLGNSYWVTDQFDSALVWYERAIPLNRNSYQLSLNRAQALYKLGRFEDARQEFIRTLMLHPRDSSTYLTLEEYGKGLGITLNRNLFSPKSMAVTSEKGIDIVYRENAGTHWIMYGMAKGMWLGEPAHRKAMTGEQARNGWTSTEEIESMLALLTTYHQLVEAGKAEREPQLDLLVEIAKDNLMLEFVVYEFGSRMVPHINLLQPEESQKSMAAFIDKYVMPRSR